MKVKLYLFLLTISNVKCYNSDLSRIPCSESCTNDCLDWIVSTNQYFDDDRFRPSIANGHIGTIAYAPDFHINGLYRGNLRGRVPNRIAFSLEPSNSTQITYTLNLYDATFTTTAYDPVSGVNTTILMYANMGDKHYLVTEVYMNSNVALSNDVTVNVYNITRGYTYPYWDLNVTNYDDTNESYVILQAVPAVLETNNVTGPNLTVISTNIPMSFTLNKGETSKTWVFYSVAVMNLDRSTSLALAKTLFEQGQGLSQIQNNGKTLFMNLHLSEWQRIWQSRYDIHGNCDLGFKVHAAQYYILSSLPASSNYSLDGWPSFGISPGSLANDDSHNYKGHIFWDQDLWMLLGILPLHPSVVQKTLLDTRVRRLEQAKSNAERYGQHGARFPWEVAYAGYETSIPPWSDYEIHITGDVALSALHYLRLSNDADFAQNFYNTSLEIATFYYNLLQPLSDKDLVYGIYGVMGPDEYHYGINNSAYINAIAQISLELPSYIKTAFNVAGVEPLAEWIEMAGMIYIPFGANRNYHPEYEGYSYGTQIKQADTILLGYPLMIAMLPTTRNNDLSIYQKVTDSAGPAMTWAMHSIGLLESGDEKSAREMFEKSFSYMLGPFGIWKEEASGEPDRYGCVNFVTGMGGFMQNLLQGYLGLRIHENRLDFTPYVVPNTTGFEVHGVNYQGMLFDFMVNTTSMQITLNNQPKSGCAFIDEHGAKMPLKIGNVFTGSIKVKRSILCQPKRCQDGWYASTVNENNCYKFINQIRTWEDSEIQCNIPGAHLVSIGNAFENNEVQVQTASYAPNCDRFNIGLFNSGNNTWRWSDDSFSSYRNWESSYPINSSINHCVLLNKGDGKWTNGDCTQTHCYICKINLN